MNPERPRSFAYTADLHLRANVWAGRPEIQDDAFVAFSHIINHCINQRLDLLLAGDTFNEARPSFDAVQFFNTQAALMHDAGLKIRFITGNHDPAPWAMLSPGTELLNDRLFNLPTNDGGLVPAYGLGYHHSSELQERLANIPSEARVLVFHQLLDLAFTREGAANMQAEWVPGHIKTALGGDYHEQGVHSDDRGISFVYPGSTCMQNIGEASPKAFYVVSLHPDGTIDALTPERIPSRPFIDMVVVDDGQVESVLTAIDQRLTVVESLLSEAIRKPVIRVRFNPTLNGFLKALTEIVGDRAYLVSNALPPTEDGEQAAAATTVEMSRRAVLATILSPQEKPELFNFVSEMLDTADPKLFLKGTRQKLGLEV